mgnify:FL=1
MNDNFDEQWAMHILQYKIALDKQRDEFEITLYEFRELGQACRTLDTA